MGASGGEWGDACTLPTVERPLRVAEFGRLFSDAVRGVERPAPTRLRLTLDPRPEVAARAARLAATETQCCSFFGFTLNITVDALSLDVTVPSAQAAVLDSWQQR